MMKSALVASLKSSLDPFHHGYSSAWVVGRSHF